MASPQKENGYTAIANELFEKMGTFRFLGSEFNILICVIRKTYGYHKKEDYISLTQFELFTGLSRPTVVNCLKNLVENNILTKNGSVYSLNKDWEKWGSKARLTSKAVLTRTSKHRLTDTSKARLTHKRKKEIKDISINKKMHTYTPIDESGNPLKRKSSTKINQTENRELIEVANLWQQLCSRHLQIPKEDVVMHRIYFPIRATYDREKLNLEQFRNLFEYFFNDKDIKLESKLSFDLCLSQKYVAKWKMKNSRKIITSVSMSSEIKL